MPSSAAAARSSPEQADRQRPAAGLLMHCRGPGLWGSAAPDPRTCTGTAVCQQCQGGVRDPADAAWRSSRRSLQSRVHRPQMRCRCRADLLQHALGALKVAALDEAVGRLWQEDAPACVRASSATADSACKQLQLHHQSMPTQHPPCARCKRSPCWVWGRLSDPALSAQPAGSPAASAVVSADTARMQAGEQRTPAAGCFLAPRPGPGAGASPTR